MKFVTYTNNDGETPRFGFKRDDEIVDVIRSGIWVNENIKDSSFLTVPTTLKLALGNWDINFSKLKNLNQAIPDADLSSLEVDEKPIAIKESEASLENITKKIETLKVLQKKNFINKCKLL